jgi:hypothetical protein
MVTFFRRQLPIILAFVIGMTMFVRNYIPHPVSENLYTGFLNWDIIITGFASILGILSLLHYHMNKIKRHQPGFAFSYVTYAGFVAMLLAGVYSGNTSDTGSPLEAGTLFHWMFMNLMVPMQSTMFAILGFFVASAAFRAFRARNTEATLLLIAAILVMLGRVPLGDIIWNKFPVISEWILNVPNMTGQRGIMLGVGLSQIAIALRILLGIERTYMGGGD